MSFISRNLRVFHKRIADDEDLLLDTGGKLRDFDTVLDPRSWSISCFERHDYLLELLAVKKNYPMKQDASVQPSKIFGSGDRDTNILTSHRSFLDNDNNSSGFVNSRYAVNVNISRRDGKQSSVSVIRNHGMSEAFVRRLEAKLLKALQENAILHRELEIVKQSNTPYIEKIQKDLEKYLELCERQKMSIYTLKRELSIMQDELSKLQKEI